MKLVGLGHEPLDLSREAHEKVFSAALGKWLTLRQQNVISGPPDIEGIELQPYGTAYAAA